jgi:O-succinylbenzoic acid--CoA ligase
VVGLPDPEWGDVPVVVTEGGNTVSLPDLRQLVAERLGRAAAPARLVEVDRLPRLASGKPDRVALAALVRAQGA